MLRFGATLAHVHPRVDILLYRYYTEIVGRYWPPERLQHRVVSIPEEEVLTSKWKPIGTSMT